MSNYVLIVDDNPSDQKVAKLLIENEGFVAVLANDAHDAIDKLSDYEFKLFVIDIQMPMVSGLDLLKQLKRTTGAKDVPALIMSGRNTTEDVKRAIGLGAIDYVIKPMDPVVFSSKIMHILHDKKTAWKEYPITGETQAAFVHETCQVVSINEIGATLSYNVEIKPGESRPIGGKIFDEIGIGVNYARFLETQKQDDGTYVSKVSFIGLKEEDRKKLRLYCRQIWLGPKK